MGGVCGGSPDIEIGVNGDVSVGMPEWSRLLMLQLPSAFPSLLRSFR